MAGVMVSAEVVEKIAEVVQDDIVIEAIEPTIPDIFFEPATEIIEHDCLACPFEYPKPDTSLRHIVWSDAQTQYKMDSKSMEYLQDKKSLCTPGGANTAPPLENPLMSL